MDYPTSEIREWGRRERWYPAFGAPVRPARFMARVPPRPGMDLRAMHSLTGSGGAGDEVALAGIVVILAAFLAWGWWQQRRARR